MNNLYLELIESFILSFILSFIFLGSTYLHAEDTLDQYIQCRRDHEVRALLPQYKDKDTCVGSYIIQGISYECGKLAGFNAKVQDFITTLNKNAKEKCEEVCHERTKDCHGKFIASDQCGYTISEDIALKYGQTYGKCSPKCSGQAFIYCSIYHAETLRYHEEFFEGKTPNCYCSR